MNEATPLPGPEENPFANLGQPLPPPQLSEEEQSSLNSLGDVASAGVDVVAEGALDVAFDFAATGVEGAANVVGAVAEGGGEVLGALGEGCAGCASISAIFFALVLAYGFVLMLA